MPRTALAQRHEPESAEVQLRLLEILKARGLTDAVLARAIAAHVDAMDNALSTRGVKDYTARQRSASYLLDLWLSAASGQHATGNKRSEGSLVNLTLVASPPAQTSTPVNVIDEIAQ